MKKRRAFTAAELIISLLVMSITYAAMSLSSASAKQTAQHEAERLAAYIFRMIQKADRMHVGFDMDMDFAAKEDGVKEYYVTIKWPGDENYEKPRFKASAGCSYTDNFVGTNGKITYNVMNKRFTNGGSNTGGTITVTDYQGEKYYVIIAVTEGRIRLSENPPD